MEGTPDLSDPIMTPDAERERNVLFVIVLFHTVGLIGFIVLAFTVFFLKLVPWHLLLMLVIIIYNHKQLNGKFISFAITVFVLGFCAELTGVHTGLLFGSYNYGLTLGLKLWGIPLVIGINWFLLIYSTGVLMQRSRVKNIFVRILTGALLLVLLDFFIEPVAIHFDYWHWAANGIPLKNYLCWFLISGAMLFIFEKFKFDMQNKAPVALLIMQFVFFMILGLIY
ncbi:carotenoid biosynthesis protein [Mucilaginibacter dorajii]|uniref:Carotenoid biosynthesis protein n=1 Tax=Mucilaginibacter dorajii TaxID=692994 RepID=A0ABP7PXL4_9SPHI|nr:carotenoid biosynthesis protein [Mucilaginibacter dorajii]MCS3736481.1 putative membrane protein [Mucilaginibacter dorajii]